MLSFSARTTSLRRGRSACSAPELALPATFRDRKPANAKATSPSAGRKKTTRKNKILTAPLKCKNLKIECFIDDAWHPATIKDGQSNLYTSRLHVHDRVRQGRLPGVSRLRQHHAHCSLRKPESTLVFCRLRVRHLCKHSVGVEHKQGCVCEQRSC